MLGPKASDIDGPEAAVAGHIPEKAPVGVAGANDDIGARMALHHGAVCLPELIIRPAEKGLDRFHIHLLDAVHLGDLQNPVALELLGCGLVPHISNGEGVGEPLPAQQGVEGGLAHSLGAVEDEHGVELDPRLINPRYRRTQSFPGHRPDVGRVLGTHVLYQQGVQPLGPVPGQAVQIFLYRVVEPLGGHHRQQSVLELRGRPHAIDPLEVQLGVGEVGVIPSGTHLLPGQRPDHIHHALELVVDDILEVGIVADDGGDVGEGVLHTASLVQLQLGLPIVPGLGGELGLRHSLTLLGKLELHLGVLDGEVLHGLEGGQLGGGIVRVGLAVQCAELVQPHHVKGVQQPTTGRVGGMVAVGKAVIVNDHASMGVGGDVVVPPRHGAVLVDVREEGVDGCGDGVGAAEGPDHPRLGQRVGLFLDFPLHDNLLAAGHRPLRRIVPVGVLCQDGIRVEQVAIDLLTHELAVRGGGGPVHQAARLVGGVIELLDADLLRHLPGHRHVLVRPDLAGQGDDEPEPGGLRGVLVGGVEVAAEGEEHLHLLYDLRGGVVHVQRQGRAGQHTVLLPAAPLQSAEDKAADVLDGILLGLGHLLELRQCLGGHLGLEDAVAELVQLHFRQPPLFVHPAVADRYLDLHSYLPAVRSRIFRVSCVCCRVRALNRRSRSWYSFGSHGSSSRDPSMLMASAKQDLALWTKAASSSSSEQ